jgi:Flp pilus assembly protein TadG
VCGEKAARRSLLARLRRDARGSTAVEFAIISPVFFAALFGIAQFGWAFLCGQSVRNALQKEARMLISAPNTTADQIKAAVLADLTNIVSPTISVAVTTETASGATVKRVSCTYSHKVLFPFAPSVTLDLSSSVVVPSAIP